MPYCRDNIAKQAVLLYFTGNAFQLSETMQTLSDVVSAYEDNSDYHSLEGIQHSYYGDQSPTEFYPMLPEQKYRPPPLKSSMCRGQFC